MKTNLKSFFNPKTIAIIGASDHPSKVGGILLKKAIKSKAKIIPINPNHSTLFGLKCYESILDKRIKQKIDLAIIAIPKAFSFQALEECGKKKIRNIILITAGFSEEGNIEDEEKNKNMAKKHKIRFMGPNCFGVCNPYHNLDLTFSATTPEKGKIAFISQSGALWSFIADFSYGKFGISGFASLGNQADLEFTDFIDYFSNDKNTKSIVLYIEKLKQGKKFMEICKKAIKRNKKIYAVKAGSSKEGSKAAFSHTGSLATDFQIYKGAFRQAGVILCETLEEAFSKASGKKLIKTNNTFTKTKAGKKAFIITNAGGAGALLSDYLSEKGFEIIDKPQDILGTALAEDYKKALEESQRKDYNSLFVILTPQAMTQIEKTAQIIADFKQQAYNEEISIIALFLGEKSMKDANKILKTSNMIYFNTIEGAKNKLTI